MEHLINDKLFESFARQLHLGDGHHAIREVMMTAPATLFAAHLRLPQCRQPLIRWIARAAAMPDPFNIIGVGSYRLPISAWFIGMALLAYLRYTNCALGEFTVEVESLLPEEDWLADRFSLDSDLQNPDPDAHADRVWRYEDLVMRNPDMFKVAPFVSA